MANDLHPHPDAPRLPLAVSDDVRRRPAAGEAEHGWIVPQAAEADADKLRIIEPINFDPPSLEQIRAYQGFVNSGVWNTVPISLDPLGVYSDSPQPGTDTGISLASVDEWNADQRARLWRLLAIAGFVAVGLLGAVMVYLK